MWPPAPPSRCVHKGSERSCGLPTPGPRARGCGGPGPGRSLHGVEGCVTRTTARRQTAAGPFALHAHPFGFVTPRNHASLLPLLRSISLVRDCVSGKLLFFSLSFFFQPLAPACRMQLQQEEQVGRVIASASSSRWAARDGDVCVCRGGRGLRCKEQLAGQPPLPLSGRAASGRPAGPPS